MSLTQDHDFHLVDPSPWPIIGAFSVFILAVGGGMYLHNVNFGIPILLAGLAMVFFTMYVWWKDVVKEGKQDEAHSQEVKMGLRIGMAFFILSEVMFFFVFFWSFFKASLDPVDIIGDDFWPIAEGMWPPEGIETFDPWDIPFMNTLVLLLSGTTVTWAHHALMEDNQKDLVTALALTIVLGVCFSGLQVFEYMHATFGFTEGIYPSNFYMATGFHGFHVFVGTLFLIVCYFRARKGHFHVDKGFLGFEFAAWYWHFVDVVWLFLFVFVYVWGA